jgi:hypothetical protein
MGASLPYYKLYDTADSGRLRSAFVTKSSVQPANGNVRLSFGCLILFRGFSVEDPLNLLPHQRSAAQVAEIFASRPGSPFSSAAGIRVDAHCSRIEDEPEVK